MSQYHEPWEALPEEARDVHRALTSLKEEIEAVDWYHQRVVLCTDPELRQVLAHNRDEEMEHATMTLEWLRRHMPGWDRVLREYLFTESLVEKVGEKHAAAGAEDGPSATEATRTRSLGIGSLKAK
jgi:ferritin-like protein